MRFSTLLWQAWLRASVGEKVLFELILISVLVLLLGLLLDLIIGDPSPNSPYAAYYRAHPTVLMGKYIASLERRLKNTNAQKEKINGVFLGLATILTFALPTFFGLWAIWLFLEPINFWLAAAVYVIAGGILFKFTVCIKLETDWARAAANAIDSGDVEEARKYAHFSRRNFTNLTGAQVASGIMESMSENIIDFKYSPIIWYSFLGVTGAVAFRAINTLDGMVGFKDKEHLNTGWFSANLDHIVNYVPARLTGILIVVAAALLGMDYKSAWAIAKRDHQKTQSRNHGWPMAAMAGALNVQFEKPERYVLGDALEPMTGKKILDALKIRNVAIMLCLLIFLPVLVAVRFFVFPF